MLRIFDHLEQLPTKEEFTSRKIIHGIALEKSILKQEAVMLSYKNDGKIISVPAKHDMVALFKINHEYFVLGSPIQNPICNSTEIKTSIGGLNKADYTFPIFHGLSHDMTIETHGELSLSDFDISPYYVCSRQPDWNEWSVCFVEIICLSKMITSMNELKIKVASMNEGATTSYGIYKLEAVVLAAQKTAGLAENASKEKTMLRNYFNDKCEQVVIFNDNDMAKIFSSLTPDQLFINNYKKPTISPCLR